MGDNGAGKSTLVKTIAGVPISRTRGNSCCSTASGAYRHAPRMPQRCGIATVYQDLALCDNLDVVANLFLGRERLHPGRAGSAAAEAEMETERTRS